MSTATLTPSDAAWWTPGHRAKVASMVGYRLPRELIAGYLDVPLHSLEGPEWEEAVRQGNAVAEAGVAQSLYNAAREGKPAAIRMWRERAPVRPYPGKRKRKEEKPLAPRMMLFAKEYLVDRNATEAAKRAGYSVRSARKKGSELFNDPRVRPLIDAGLRKLAAKIEATAVRTVEEIAYVGFSDVGHFMTVNEAGEPHLDLTDLPEGATRAISEVIIESRTVGEETITKTKLKLHPKVPALSLLAQIRGLLVQRHEHSGRDGAPIETTAKMVFTMPSNGR